MIRANNDLVAVAWLSSCAGINPGMVGTQVPTDNASFAASGFLTVAVVGGTPHPSGGIRMPVIQVDAWAVPASATSTTTTGKPPWGRASDLLERVLAACQDEATLKRALTLRAGYRNAYVIDAYPETEPRRVTGEPTPVARYTMDLSLHWAELPEG